MIDEDKLNKFCGRCGQKLDPNSIAHFCNADRFCESCGEKLPVVCFSNDRHICPEEKITITKKQLEKALTAHLINGYQFDALDLVYEELGFK